MAGDVHPYPGYDGCAKDCSERIVERNPKNKYSCKAYQKPVKYNQNAVFYAMHVTIGITLDVLDYRNNVA